MYSVVTLDDGSREMTGERSSSSKASGFQVVVVTVKHSADALLIGRQRSNRILSEGLCRRVTIEPTLLSRSTTSEVEQLLGSMFLLWMHPTLSRRPDDQVGL